MQAAITNLGKYNEGELDFVWLELPATEDEFEEALGAIGIGECDGFGIPYEEWFVSDYDTGMGRAVQDALGEYPGFDELNRVGEAVSELEDVDTFGELFGFCSDNDVFWVVEDLVDDDCIDSMVRAAIDSGDGWRRVAGFLANCGDLSREWYRIDGHGNLKALYGSDLEDLTAAALEALLLRLEHGARAPPPSRTATATALRRTIDSLGIAWILRRMGLTRNVMPAFRECAIIIAKRILLKLR